MRYSRKSGYVLGFNTNLKQKFFNSGPRPCLLLNDAKNFEKRTTKSRACVPLNKRQEKRCPQNMVIFCHIHPVIIFFVMPLTAYY
jgi:hypothetical protein